jgi:hypothetical protein
MGVGQANSAKLPVSNCARSQTLNPEAVNLNWDMPYRKNQFHEDGIAMGRQAETLQFKDVGPLRYDGAYDKRAPRARSGFFVRGRWDGAWSLWEGLWIGRQTGSCRSDVPIMG